MAITFECTTQSLLTPHRMFDLARDIGAHTESMSRSRETAVAGVRSGLIGLGEEVTWRAWHFGVPLRMTSRITAMNAPQSFTDEQIRGPFRFFRHEHEFTAAGTGSIMIDRVSFAAPLGIRGRVVERAILARYLKQLIERRNTHLQSVTS
jgi:ligand-binding SRPBCC domain-containing protein